MVCGMALPTHAPHTDEAVAGFLGGCLNAWLCHEKRKSDFRPYKITAGLCALILPFAFTRMVHGYCERFAREETYKKKIVLLASFTAAHAILAWYLGGRSLAKTAVIPGIPLLIVLDGERKGRLGSVLAALIVWFM